MSGKMIYLAGPIADCSEGEAKNWRAFVDAELREYEITCISPLRCEPMIGEAYKLTYSDPSFGTGRAIFAKNLFDVKRCDLTLAYLPKPPEGRRQSYGTMIEMGLAFAFSKTIILVSDDPNVTGHPCLDGVAHWSFDNLAEAIRCIRGIMGPKNV